MCLSSQGTLEIEKHFREYFNGAPNAYGADAWYVDLREHVIQVSEQTADL